MEVSPGLVSRERVEILAGLRENDTVILGNNEAVGLWLATLLKYLAPFARQPAQMLMIGHDLLAWRQPTFYSLLPVRSRGAALPHPPTESKGRPDVIHTYPHTFVDKCECL